MCIVLSKMHVEFYLCYAISYKHIYADYASKFKTLSEYYPEHRETRVNTD